MIKKIILALISFSFVFGYLINPQKASALSASQTDFSGGASSEIHTINWGGDNWNKYYSATNITWLDNNHFKLTDPNQEGEIVTSIFNSGDYIFFSIMSDTNGFSYNQWWRAGLSPENMADWTMASPTSAATLTRCNYKVKYMQYKLRIRNSPPPSENNYISLTFRSLKFELTVTVNEASPPYYIPDAYAEFNGLPSNAQVSKGIEYGRTPADISYVPRAVQYKISIDGPLPNLQLTIKALAEGYQSQTMDYDGCRQSIPFVLKKIGGTSTTSTSSTATKSKAKPSPPTISSINGQSLPNNKVLTNSIKYGQPIILSGTTITPNSTIKLWIYSDPITAEVKSDKKGNWSYTLTQALPPGEHRVEAQLIDPKGNTSAKVVIAKFTVAGTTAGYGSTITKPLSTKVATLSPLVYGLGGAALILIGLLVYLIIKRRKAFQNVKN